MSPPEPRVEWKVEVSDTAALRGIADGIAYVGGRSLYALDAADGSEMWRVEGRRKVEAEAVEDDVAYVVRDGDLQAHSATTGQHRWTFDGASQLNCHDGTVFTVKRGTGRLYALDAVDGSERWTADLYAHPLMPPAVGDETLYVGDSGNLHALDPVSGEVRWSIAVGGDDFVHPVHTWQLTGGPSPVRDGVILVWSAGKGVLFGLSAADGSVRWRVEHPPKANAAPVALHDATVYIAGSDALTSHDAVTGARRWRVSTDGASRPRVAGDTVYVSDGQTVHAVDAAAGTRRWQHRTDSDRVVNVGEPAAGVVPVSSFDGWVGALDAADGSLRWRHDHGGEPAWFPETADGTVYLGTRDGRAMALSAPDDPGSPLRRLTPAALAGSLGVAGALAAAGYRRLRSDP